VEFAIAMLSAAEQSWEAARATYAQGLCTVVELLTAERNLAQARATDIDSRAGLLKAAAELVYAAGGQDDSDRSRDSR
jgi:outer membrane protein TolC